MHGSMPVVVSIHSVLICWREGLRVVGRVAYLCFPVPMFPGTDVPRTYMFPGAYVPRYLCSPVPMFPGFCTLIVVISINRL